MMEWTMVSKLKDRETDLAKVSKLRQREGSSSFQEERAKKRIGKGVTRYVRSLENVEKEALDFEEAIGTSRMAEEEAELWGATDSAIKDGEKVERLLIRSGYNADPIREVQGKLKNQKKRITNYTDELKSKKEEELSGLRVAQGNEVLPDVKYVEKEVPDIRQEKRYAVYYKGSLLYNLNQKELEAKKRSDITMYRAYKYGNYGRYTVKPVTINVDYGLKTVKEIESGEYIGEYDGEGELVKVTSAPKKYIKSQVTGQNPSYGEFSEYEAIYKGGKLVEERFIEPERESIQWQKGSGTLERFKPTIVQKATYEGGGLDKVYLSDVYERSSSQNKYSASKSYQPFVKEIKDFDFGVLVKKEQYSPYERKESSVYKTNNTSVGIQKGVFLTKLYDFKNGFVEDYSKPLKEKSKIIGEGIKKASKNVTGGKNVTAYNPYTNVGSAFVPGRGFVNFTAQSMDTGFAEEISKAKKNKRVSKVRNVFKNPGLLGDISFF